MTKPGAMPTTGAADERAGGRIQACAAILGGLAVLLGAFGAHVIAESGSAERLRLHNTAAQYQLWHAIAIWLAGGAVRRGAPGQAAACCFLAGIILFSGSLYAMAETGVRSLGAVTPFGGLFLVVGWALLVHSALARRR